MKIEDSIQRASVPDTAAVLFEVILPALAKGVILRRPLAMRVADGLNLDRRAIVRMQRTRHKYGSGPLLLRIPGRSIAIPLRAEDVHRVLDLTPDPFATATPEKRAALAHFEPKNVLLSAGQERVEWRRYNEEVLDAHQPFHRLADQFAGIVDEEADEIAWTAKQYRELNWAAFSEGWSRIVRRVVFGDEAREDRQLSRDMETLRAAANWAFLRPQKTELREQLMRRVCGYLERAESGSLAQIMGQIHPGERTAPEQQVPQWLFAFDPAGMATYRTLALLASHVDYGRAIRAEIGARDMPGARAAVLESLRLWPTTPFLLRETTRATAWTTGELPARSTVLIFTPFFHRDSEQLACADRFSPELWRNGEEHSDLALVPFSEGPAVCPGRHLVLFLATSMLAAILRNARVRLKDGRRLRGPGPLPATLNHFTLRFELRD